MRMRYTLKMMMPYVFLRHAMFDSIRLDFIAGLRNINHIRHCCEFGGFVHRVVKLQSELAHAQARLSTFQTVFPLPGSARSPMPSLLAPSAAMASIMDSGIPSDPSLPLLFDPPEILQQAQGEIAAAVALELVSLYLPGVSIEPPPASTKSP
ncbi:hypothetical protein SAY86_003497 [Trapa natans]|uniref:LOB domain-containing protein n=1 Tax=Trapa natans TaxID=22666 RepID=A0AAN7MWS0_TRANT|nr:hypothetical protein SAY86_003497 [Trapa natans]